MPQKKKIFHIIAKYGTLTIIVIILRTFVLTPITIIGISMEPTFHERDCLWQTSLLTPKRFNTVTFPSPRTGNIIIKRIIGLPGDTVRYQNDQLLINERPFDEPYLTNLKKEIPVGSLLTENFSLTSLLVTHTTKVPKDKYFVLGDNRQKADDSRYFGFVDKKTISGVIYFRYYPFNKIGTQ